MGIYTRWWYTSIAFRLFLNIDTPLALERNIEPVELLSLSKIHTSVRPEIIFREFCSRYYGAAITYAPCRGGVTSHGVQILCVHTMRVCIIMYLRIGTCMVLRAGRMKHAVQIITKNFDGSSRSVLTAVYIYTLFIEHATGS